MIQWKLLKDQARIKQGIADKVSFGGITLVTAVKLKHVQLSNQIRASLSFLHLSHFSSIAALLHHPTVPPSQTNFMRKHPSTHRLLFLLTCLLKHFYTWFLKILPALEIKKKEQEMRNPNPHSYLEPCRFRRELSVLNKEGAHCIQKCSSVLHSG